MSAPRPGQPRRTRRHVLGSAGAAALALALAACGSDTSGRYSSGSGSGDGYVAGDGAAIEIPAADRGEAVEFTGTTYAGDAFDLASQRGHVVVLNIWYASCAPCRKEAPQLTSISEDYAGKGVAFVGINVRDEAGPAQAFERRFSIPYPSLPDLDASIMYALRGQVAPNAVPSTLVLDADGRVAARISGAADPSTLRSMIDRVLAA